MKNECEEECKLYKECSCDLCISYQLCETRMRCVKYDNLNLVRSCAYFTDWLTKMTNPKLYKASLEYIEARKDLKFRVNI